jgi:hypothetical protein
MKLRNLRIHQKSTQAPRNLDFAVVSGPCLGFVPQIPMPFKDSSGPTGGRVSERIFNEMTLDMSFVHQSIEILSLCLDCEFTRQSTITTSCQSSRE